LASSSQSQAAQVFSTMISYSMNAQDRAKGMDHAAGADRYQDL
jgi:hypothetical protein